MANNLKIFLPNETAERTWGYDIKTGFEVWKYYGE